MSKPKSTHPDLSLDCLLDTSFNTKEAFLKAFSLYGDEIEAARQTDISLLTLEKLKASDAGFTLAIKKLTSSLSAAKAKRTKLINSTGETLRETLKLQGLYSPLSELYIEQYAAVRYDLDTLEQLRTSPHYDPTSKHSVEPLVKARRAELNALLKTLTTPTKQATSNSKATLDPLSSLF